LGVTVTIRREVNLINETVSGATDYPSATCAAISLDSDDYSGTVGAYLEVVAKNSDASAQNVGLDRDDAATMGSPSSVANATIAITGNTASWTRFRSSSFTLHSTDIYYHLVLAHAALSVLAARIVLIQTVADATDLIKSVGQFEIGAREELTSTGSSNPLAEPKFFQYTDANWATGVGNAGCSQVDWYVSCVYAGDAMTTGLSARWERSTDFTNWTVISTLFEGLGGSIPTYIETSVPNAGMIDGNWYRITFAGGKEQMQFWNVHVIAKQIGTTANPLLKTEDNYLMANKQVWTSGPAEYKTLWDPTTNEWEGVANEYIHQGSFLYFDAADAKEIRLIEDGATVPETGSSVDPSSTGIKHALKGSTMTLDTDATTLDLWHE
jgi:hypothetical protein